MTNPADLIAAPDFDDLRAKMELGGLTRSEAITIAGTYVLSLVNVHQRVFFYSKPLPATAPGCQSTFTPRFEHRPWVDGEDVVQAGETPGGDVGFNRRFSNIEFDLRDLAQGLRDAYACLATLRAEVAGLLGELRGEINRINGDIHRLSGGAGPGPLPPPFGGPGSVGGVFGGALGGIRFLGTGKVLDRDVQLWDTRQGTMMLPQMTTVAAKEVDTRVQRVRELGGLLATNAELARRLEAGPITKAQLVEEFGDLRAGRTTLREIVAILPPKQRIAGAAALLDLVAEREALALRTGPGRELALVAAFGVDEKIDVVSAVAVEKFMTVPAAARIALMEAGIDTMERLAAVDDAKLAAALERGGVAATAAESAGWRAAARTLVHL